jgi:hypothetical protein
MRPSTKFISIVTIGLILGLIIMYLGAKSPKDSYFDRALSQINIFTIFFLGMGVYISIIIWDRNIENTERDSILRLVDRLFNDLAKTWTTYYPKCPKLIDSLFLPWQQRPMGNIIIDKDKPDQWTAVNYVSLRVFQAWEDFLTINNADQTGAEMWITIFIPYANSKILYDIWQVYNTSYDPPTRMFGDLLFKNVLNNSPKNIDELRQLTRNIINSPEYKEAIFERSKL